MIKLLISADVCAWRRRRNNKGTLSNCFGDGTQNRMRVSPALTKTPAEKPSPRRRRSGQCGTSACYALGDCRVEEQLAVTYVDARIAIWGATIRRPLDSAKHYDNILARALHLQPPLHQ